MHLRSRYICLKKVYMHTRLYARICTHMQSNAVECFSYACLCTQMKPDAVEGVFSLQTGNRMHSDAAEYSLMHAYAHTTVCVVCTACVNSYWKGQAQVMMCHCAHHRHGKPTHPSTHAIGCSGMQSYVRVCIYDRMFVYANTCSRMQLHAIACI